MGNMIKRCPCISDAKESRVSPRILFGEKLMRNVLVASLLLACIVGSRDMLLSPEKNVLTTLQTAVESEWDENLGRLVYTNNTLSQAIAVFSPTHNNVQLYQPCSTQVVDVFSDDAPYIVYQPSQRVLTAAACEVTSVSYTPTLGYTIHTYCDNGLECLYSGLSACFAVEGDVLPAQAEIGSCNGKSLIFEVRKNGVSVDASTLFIAQQVQ